MSANNGNEEKRNHPRHAVKKKVVARFDGKTEDDIDALLRDVSAGGAAVNGGFDLDEDDPVALDIEDVGVFASVVAHSFDDGIGVRFIDIDEDEEDQLLSDLAELDAQIRTDEF